MSPSRCSQPVCLCSMLSGAKQTGLTPANCGTLNFHDVAIKVRFGEGAYAPKSAE